MTAKTSIPSVRVLPEDVANKIAAGEVVERPASVVKELVENALDARATRITVRLVGAGRRLIEVTDNGHGMSEHDALLALERHATSKIRKADDLDNIHTLGFRGEAVPSIASVSRFELVTRREKDDAATRIRVDGGLLRDVGEIAAPVGTRVVVNRLYFNTPVRAKFLRGMTTELSHVIDCVQRHALAEVGVAFQLLHNDKLLLDVPAHASLRERIALIWGMGFAKELVDIEADANHVHISGLIGTPALTRSARSHQFLFLNKRPVVSRALQYGLGDAYRGLLTVGRFPVGVLLLECPPRMVDVNVHPAKREVRFRDERAVRDAIRDSVRARLADLRKESMPTPPKPEAMATTDFQTPEQAETVPSKYAQERPSQEMPPPPEAQGQETQADLFRPTREPVQQDIAPEAVYEPMPALAEAPMQVFGTYLLVPDGERLLIVDQHALHERLTYDALRADLADTDYQSQQLVVPVLVDVPPSHARLLTKNMDLFRSIGIEIEPFGGDSFQISAVCPLYDESKIPDVVYRILDDLAQGDLFDREDLLASLMRLAVAACRGSVKAGDQLTVEERAGLLQGFRQLTPPYTCPHGRPIVTELTQAQMEKSFRRRQ